MKILIAAVLSSLSMALPLDFQAHDHAPAETLGSVTFSTSCDPAVQPQFDRAVALMHSFQFGPAIQGFHSILATDPSCAIADWGIALSSWGNPFAGFKSPAQMQQGLKAVEQGRAVGAKTERERAYIDAVAHLYTDNAQVRLQAYEAAMAAVSAAYPKDTEATIFYALALAAAADPSDKTYAKQLKAGALLEKLFVTYPNHPGLAHYIIHTYDEPALASRAAEAARRYGEIAPSTPHALHMPSHTFTRVGDWQASIDTNISSAATARTANQPADVLHASDYMVYAYLQTAQNEAAKRVVESSAQTFLTFDPAHATGAAPASAAYFAHAAIPARYCLERRAWSDAAKLEPLTSPFPFADAITYFARGLGAAHMKDGSAAREAIRSLEQIRDKLAGMKEDYWAGQIEIQRQEVVAMLGFSEGHEAEAVSQMRRAAELEDKTELSSITPGPLVPAREMLGDLLLETKQPAEALKEFQATLVKEPNRFWTVYGAAEAAKQAGDRQKSSEYFQQLLTVAKRADQPGRTELAEARAAIRHD
jgi:tetratricopeptide (TPR) repeat protein